jgi:hypothetical protein
LQLRRIERVLHRELGSKDRQQEEQERSPAAATMVIRERRNE